jgi:hypothetical protein
MMMWVVMLFLLQNHNIMELNLGLFFSETYLYCLFFKTDNTGQLTKFYPKSPLKREFLTKSHINARIPH